MPRSNPIAAVNPTPTEEAQASLSVQLAQSVDSDSAGSDEGAFLMPETRSEPTQPTTTAPQPEFLPSLAGDADPKLLADLTLEEKKAILRDYLFGHSIEEICATHNCTKQAVRIIGTEQSVTRTQMEREYCALSAAREAVRTADLKDKLLDLLSGTIDQAAKEADKIALVPHTLAILNSVDRIHRLDGGTPTDIQDTRVTTADLAQMMKELKTPEDKRRFLAAQVQAVRQPAKK